MRNDEYVRAFGILCLALTACGRASNDGLGEPGSASFTGGGDGYGPGAAGAGGVSGMAASATAGAGSIGDPGCAPGVPSTTQIPRLSNRQYDAVLTDLLGVTTLASADNQKPSALLAPDFDGNMGASAWQLYQSTAATIAHEVMIGPNKAKFIACDPSSVGCLDQTVQSFGRKAFRRPLSEGELARFQKLSQTTPAGTPDEVAETILFAFLASPSFLLLPELSSTPDASGQGIRLSSFEVATRLSLLLWGSVPDDALNAAADADLLTTNAQILAQARRMIAVREKSAKVVTAFHRQWAQVDSGNGHWWKTNHDPAKFPLYSDAARAAFQAELDAFFEEVVFAGGAFADLFTSNVGFVNQSNAAIYGLDPAAYGSDLKRVELDSAQRPGFLTRGGFLSSYSGESATSPILRGAFIARNVVGNDPGPQPNVQIQTPASASYATNRALTEALTDSAGCRPCHSIINPLGYAFENYDAIGKWQTVDPLSGPIDASASVALSSSDDREPIDSPLQLMQAIVRTPEARHLYAQAWVSYAFGRSPNARDSCVVDRLDLKLDQAGYSVLDLLSELAQADSFRLRSREMP